MRKALFEPVRDVLPSASCKPCKNGHESDKADQHEATFAKSSNILVGSRNGRHRAWEENGIDHQGCKRANVEDPLHCPNCQLRRDWEPSSACYQVGTNQLTWTSEES